MNITELTKSQHEILDHTAHRTANECFCGDSPDMQVLVELGLMYCVGKTGFCSDKYFRLTPKGRKSMKGQ